MDTLDFVIEDGNGIIVCIATYDHISQYTVHVIDHHNIHAYTMMHIIIIIYNLCI